MAEFHPGSLRPHDLSFERRLIERGWWTQETLGQMVLGWLRAKPELDLRIWSKVRPQRSTFGGVADLSLRMAAGLRQFGVGERDAVCIYLPNSLEGIASFVASPLLGAAVVPVAPYYGMHELGFILRRSGARVLITSEAPQGGRLQAIAELRAELPELKDIFVVGPHVPEGMRPFEELVAHAPLQDFPAVDPDDVALLAFTSGTTSEPKGVVHTHRSICAVCNMQLAQAYGHPPRPLLFGGPIAHAAGMMGGAFLPALRGLPIHIVDGWDARMVLEATRECDLSAGGGAPFFLNSLLALPDFGPEDHARVGSVMVGGAPVPAPFIERCERLGIHVLVIYGATEVPMISSCRVDDPFEKRCTTVGRPLDGVEVRIVDEFGVELPAGEIGHVLARGPNQFAGYIDPALNSEAFTETGWFRTGDIGSLDADGFLAITDRTKDIIIRNGVKISAVEVEAALLRMETLQEVAVVAQSDERTGERAFAFVRLRPGAAAPSLEAVRTHLEQAGLAKQKFPEGIQVIDEFPRTPAGKVKKFALRDLLRSQVT
jgi:acyl-CoA synthetase (AMP-forming)/AMP-acid ligase II